MEFSVHGVGCHFLLQGIFPTQGSNLHPLHPLHWCENSFPLCLLGSPLFSVLDAKVEAPSGGDVGKYLFLFGATDDAWRGMRVLPTGLSQLRFCFFFFF